VLLISGCPGDGSSWKEGDRDREKGKQMKSPRALCMFCSPQQKLFHPSPARAGKAWSFNLKAVALTNADGIRSSSNGL